MSNVRSHLRRALALGLVLLPRLVVGQVLEESTSPLRAGFRVLHRSQVNGPGSFEGVGHISFVYFGDQRLCQCGAGEFFISPSGASAIFLGERGIVMLFRVQGKKAEPLTKEFVSSISRVEWSETSGAAEVFFEQLSPPKPAPRPLRVSLKNGT